MSKNILFYMLLLTFIFSNLTLNAQMRTRLENDSIQSSTNGYWYIPSLHQYETQFPKLNSVPPLSYTMDYETLLSYIFLDSITKFSSTDFIYENYLERWIKNSTKNDTTINAIKYQYKIIDYDPVRYEQYHWNISKEYENSIFSIKSMVSELFSALLGDKNSYGHTSFENKAYNDMFRAEYILKIKVNSIDSIPKLNYPRKNGIVTNEYIYQIKATVLDTLKGKVFQNCYQPPLLKQPNQIQTTNSEISFVYGTGRYRNDQSQFQLDPSLINDSGDFSLHLDQEAIVLLEFSYYFWDYNYDYFQLHLFTAYPVIQEEVKDISKVWSQDISLPYSIWKIKFNEKRYNILNGGF